MKKIIFILMFWVSATLVMSQEVTISFTAQGNNGEYHPFDKVKIENLTRGWSHELAYPDTTLVLSSPSTEGIDVATREGWLGMKVYPNPFAGRSEAELQLTEGGEVSIRIVNIDGSVVSEYDGVLAAGGYRIDVSMSKPQVAFLCVDANGRRLVSKLVNCGEGGADNISVSSNGRVCHREAKDAELDYAIGMRYVALSSEGGVMNESLTVANNITGEDGTVTFTFMEGSDCKTIGDMQETLWSGSPDNGTIDVAWSYSDTLLLINTREQYELIFGRFMPLDDFNFGEYTIIAAFGMTPSGIVTHEMSTECDNSIFSIYLDVHLNLADVINTWGFIIKTPKITDPEKVAYNLYMHE